MPEKKSCPRCGDPLHWADDQYVCQACGDEWAKETIEEV